MNHRLYGNTPYQVAVIHGGPGAPGTMKRIAEELSTQYGVIEPFQSADTITGQVLELRGILDLHCEYPITLIGHSWGAWLAYIFASKYPKLVKKLILIGSGSFESEYLTVMNEKRANRLNEEELKKVSTLYKIISDKDRDDRYTALKEFGELMSKADSYAPISICNDALDFDADIFNNCMNELNRIRESKELLKFGTTISCPVIAIHGEYDSHSYEGVKYPLSKVIKDFKFFLLENCGHTPWNEVYAKDIFYQIIHNELGECLL